MAVDGMRFLVQLRKLSIRTVRASTRSVRKHPLLVGGLLFVIFLYRSSPFLFSLLVSASPVLVCTAVLLGTLLSFGNPQIPEFDKDEKISCEISSLKTAAVSNSSTVVHKEEDNDLGDSAFSVSRFEGSVLTPQNSGEIVFEQQSVSREVEFTREDDDEVLGSEGDHGVIDESFESENFEETTLTFEGEGTDYEVQEKRFENDGSREGSDYGNVGDFAESSSVPWTRVNGDHGDDQEDEDDDDDDDDSGSDGDESSSPDPSMADIIPLLDELHPLIECESLIPNNLSREDSSGFPRNDSHHSDEETDHKSEEEEEEEVGDDDDEEEENRGDKEDAEKSAITWTEDDQKNLMDLGSSEMERNQRLESLIARRRARRSMRMTPERNLIDLDDLVLPFQVAPISTTRQNPFDFPNDSFDNMDLPPIPGSAPSIMLKRRNPFDIPYDSSEEKPDLMDDSFQQEFMPPIQKEPVFRRHESFHIGSSIFEFPRLEARDSNRTSRFRPYFIPERLASEGGSSVSSFSEASSFQRQISELSGSLLFHRQISEVSETSSFQRQLSDLSESKASSAAETEPVSPELNQEEMKAGDHDHDTEIDHASEHVEHGSQLSENFDDQIEKRDFDLQMPEIILGEEFNQHEQGLGAEINLGSSGNDRDVDSWVSEASDLVASAVIIESSISSEHNDVKEADEGLVKGEEIGFHSIENSDVESENLFNTENLFNMSDFHHHHRHTHSAERSVLETSLTLETIEEEHIISPSSSLTSEGLKLDDALIYKERIKPDDNNSDFPTEQTVDSSNLGLSMELEESRVEDPVNDLSPQGSRINLCISSEELADLESKDLKLEQENVGEHSTKVDPGFFSIADVSTEEPYLVNENALLPANVVNVSGSFEEQVISVADEGQSVEDHWSIHSPPFHCEEDPFVLPETLEGVSSENIQHSEVYPEMNDLLSPPPQTVGTSSIFQELAQGPVSDFIDFSEPVEGGGEFEFESSIFGDKNTAFTDSSVPQSDIITEMDEALLSELDVVGDFHVTELGVPSTQETLEAENIDSGINELQETQMSEGKNLFQSLDLESVENIEKSGDDYNQKSFPDLFFINESQPEVQNTDVFNDELSYVEPTENVKQFSDEDPEKSESEVLFINTYEPEVEDAETGIAHIPEPESSQSDENAEIFGSVEGTEVDLLGGFESDIKTDDPVTILGDTSELEKELMTETSESFTTVEEEIERPTVASIDVSLDSRVLESSTLIEEGSTEEITESVHSLEEEIERVDAINVSLDSHVLESETMIEKNELAEEVNESVYSVEEEIERSANDDLIEKDEQPAAEISDTDPPMEEEIEKSAIDASFDYLIEKDERPAAEINDTDPTMEEETESSAIDSSFDDLIEKDEHPAVEKNDIDPAVEEEIERSATDASVDALIGKDEQPATETNDTDAPMEEEIERSAINASFDALIEKDEQLAAETNDTDPAMEEAIDKSAIDASSNDLIEKDERPAAEMNNTDAPTEEEIERFDDLIEKDEQPAAETNDLDPPMKEEIERSAIDASFDDLIEKDDRPAAEIEDTDPPMEEEIKRSTVDACFGDLIEKDEQPATETNDANADMEEEIERSTFDASFDDLIKKDEQLATEKYETDLPVEEETEWCVIDASSDSQVSTNEALIEKDEQSDAGTDEMISPMIQEIERSVIDASSDSHVSEKDAEIEKDGQPVAEINEPAPTMEEEIDALFENTEINEFVPDMEEEIEGSANAGIDASSDSHLSENDAQIEKDEQLAEEINELVTTIEEENYVLIKNAEANESAPIMEEEIKGSVSVNAGIDASSEFHVSEDDTQFENDEQPAAETNVSVPFTEDIETSAIDALTDLEVSESNALTENTETNESSLVMEEEKEIVNVGIVTSSDSHVLNNDTVIEKDVPAQEVGNHEADSLPASQQLTSAQTPCMQIESAESQALQEEDHLMGQAQLLVGDLATSTENVSVTEESLDKGSSDAAPEMHKREEE